MYGYFIDLQVLSSSSSGLSQKDNISSVIFSTEPSPLGIEIPDPNKKANELFEICFSPLIPYKNFSILLEHLLIKKFIFTKFIFSVFRKNTREKIFHKKCTKFCSFAEEVNMGAMMPLENAKESKWQRT